ncbi:transposase family protein [Actinomyces respiraculi]|uniref:Transposase family protein n=1 Tax=Actinomyces respiraculi TaxID=2744574 RepID=A0A7T0LJF0_9ACTO|nr:transposase family protein [Actinomyces respiraculi]
MRRTGSTPDGGGWRYVGRQQGTRDHQRAQELTPRAADGLRVRAWLIDDHCRLVRCEVHDDQTAATATAILVRAVAGFAQRGVSIDTVLSDNGSACTSHLWLAVCDQHGITVSKTRPYRPQTNGKIERFHETLADGWACTSGGVPARSASASACTTLPVSRWTGNWTPMCWPTSRSRS